MSTKLNTKRRQEVKDDSWLNKRRKTADTACTTDLVLAAQNMFNSRDIKSVEKYEDTIFGTDARGEILYWAVKNKRVEFIRFYLKHHTGVIDKNYFKDAFEAACQVWDATVIDLLINHGLETRGRTRRPVKQPYFNRLWNAGLRGAFDGHHFDLVLKLIGYGATDVRKQFSDLCEWGDIDFVIQVFRLCESIYWKDDTDDREHHVTLALHTACSYQNIPAVEFLVKHVTRIDLDEFYTWSHPVQVAVLNNCLASAIPPLDLSAMTEFIKEGVKRSVFSGCGRGLGLVLLEHEEFKTSMANAISCFLIVELVEIVCEYCP